MDEQDEQDEQEESEDNKELKVEEIDWECVDWRNGYVRLPVTKN